MFVFSGCITILNDWSAGNADPWTVKKEERGIYYYLIADDGRPARKNHPAKSAIILGLVDEEAEIEELVIPETLGGYPVTRIGESYSAIITAPTYKYDLNAEHIKKIIFNHNVALYDPQNYSNYPHKENDIETGVSLILNDAIDIYSSYYPLCKLIKFNKEIIVDWQADELRINDIKVNNYYQSAVIFDACGGNQKTYADIVRTKISYYEYPKSYSETIGAVIEAPEIPTRQGYNFGGWYTDETYETAWDFANDKVTENITLYAQWNKK